MARRYTLKKYKPKRKLNVKRTLNQKVFYILSSFVLFSYLSIKVINNINKIKFTPSNIFSNTIKSVSVDIKDIKISKDIENYVINFKSNIHTNDIDKKIISYINDNYPYIKNIKVVFNPITGGIKIKGDILDVIAYINDKDKQIYILENGEYSDLYYNLKQVIEIKTDNHKINNNDVELIKRFLSVKDQFPDISILFNSDTINIYTGGNRIIWGSYKFFNKKIDKIKYVLNDVKSKINGNVTLDLKYFENGRIIVSPIK